MKEIKVQDAVGAVLCHDITEIIPNKFKGRAFKKGHIITEEDIPHLLRIGKEHIFVYEQKEGFLHENEAAERMAKASVGANISLSEIKEGKIELRAASDGVVKINKDALFECSSNDEICFATIHNNRPVKKGELLGGMRAIPLVIKEEIIISFESVCKKSFPIIEVKPVRSAKIGVVTTGNEVLKGRIEDKFSQVIEKKAEEYGCLVIGQTLSGDDKDVIVKSIFDYIDKGADIVIVTGGMSVDPDDRTPAAISSCGGEVITYGAPVLPGAMFMLSYVNNIPVMGLPGCVMYAERTIFDLVFPRILTGEKLSKKDFVIMSCGGQCLGCDVCVFPRCSFGE